MTKAHITKVENSILETKKLIRYATKRYERSIECLKMEIAENKELGNPISANQAWVQYALDDLRKLKQYKLHLTILYSMLD